MERGVLFHTGQWEILLLFLVLLLAASELGFRLGRRAQGRTAESTKSQVGAVEAAILGLLGLLLGFTMAMAVSRYEARKQIVQEEANAIGTAYLRTRLLPAPEGPEIAELLRQYVQVKLDYTRVGLDPALLAAKRAQAARLQEAFWSRAVAAARKDPNPVTAGLLLQALNQAIDLEATHWMTFHNRVPEAVIYVNALVSLLAVLLVGYAFGLQGRRQVFSMCLLALAIAMVLTVIVDLDRPLRGLIQVSQQPMIELQQQMQPPPQ